MSISIQYFDGANSAEAIVRTVERAVADHRVGPGDRLPTVRDLAAEIGVSASTVAAAYRTLTVRGIVTGRGRRGTTISAGPPLPSRPAPTIPAGTRNLVDGNPDPALLPPLRPVLRRIEGRHVTYGEATADLPALVDLARASFIADGIPAERVLVVSGALDGVERVLQAHLRPGDRVAVEDPGFARIFDLIGALGLVAVPVAIDDRGMRPEALRDALRDGASAMVITPRAQNPTGAALDTVRTRELRSVIHNQPDLLVIEDDHAGPIAGPPTALAAHTLADRQRERWVIVRSVAKSLGPDLRVALLTGDRVTLDRVEGRLRLGAGWVSHILQHIVADELSDPRTATRIDRAGETYAERRSALIDALATHSIESTGRSGLNVWVPVTEEEATISALAFRGWAVSGGERFRLRSGPALRITISTLEPSDARRLADDLAAILHPSAAPTTMA